MFCFPLMAIEPHQMSSLSSRCAQRALKALISRRGIQLHDWQVTFWHQLRSRKPPHCRTHQRKAAIRRTRMRMRRMNQLFQRCHQEHRRRSYQQNTCSFSFHRNTTRHLPCVKCASASSTSMPHSSPRWDRILWKQTTPSLSDI